jgi:hypothetical protein
MLHLRLVIPLKMSISCRQWHVSPSLGNPAPLLAQVTYKASDVLNAYGVIIVPLTSTPTSQSSSSSLASQVSTLRFRHRNLLPYLHHTQDIRLHSFAIALTTPLILGTQRISQSWDRRWHRCTCAGVGLGRSLDLSCSPTTKEDI